MTSSSLEQSGPWRRVLIVGGPGSGKTTLGHRISRQLGCSLVELDVVGYEDGVGEERPLETRLSDDDICA